MQAFEYKDNNKYIGILHQPNTGEQIRDNQLDSLITIIKGNYEDYRLLGNLLAEDKIMLNTLNNQNNKLTFAENINEEQLGNITYFLQNTYGEQIIVPQNMGNGPAIRHRPLFFDLDIDDKSIIVKYTTFGDFNNFNIALSILK